MATFTDEPWESPESTLDTAESFCAVCLLDGNPPGEAKIKALCRLPVRTSPSGPYSRAALRNCASRIFQMTGVSPEDKRLAARKLARLMAEAGIEVGDPIKRLAGVR